MKCAHTLGAGTMRGFALPRAMRRHLLCNAHRTSWGAGGRYQLSNLIA